MSTTAAIIIIIAATGITVNSKQPSCSNGRVFIATEGQILSGRIISTYQVNSMPDCHSFCLQHPRCLSYNYQYNSTTPSHVCEINNATGEMCPHNMTRAAGFKYYEDTEHSACGRPCPSPGSYESNFQLSFPAQSASNYVRYDVQSCAPPLTAFTVCVWVKVGDQPDDGAMFSYSTSDEDNEILVTDYTSLRIMVGGRARKIEIAVNDDQWHNICTSWENAAGSWNVYIDGASVANGTDFETGHVISNNGIVILGQDQDEFGGGFEQYQSFFGEMYGVNMWNAVLSAEEISHMSRNCSNGVGNYLRWSDFETGLHGNVTIVSPTSCSP